MIGIIGGSGLYKMEGLKIIKEEKIKTPFGEPSDNYIIGELEGKDVVFLPRHGKHHTILPTEINFRANIYGMKVLGVKRIISVSAVGSLKEDLKPTDIVLPDQFIDWTRHRKSTFFGEGIVAHTSFSHPICPELIDILDASCKKINAIVHKGGTYICMEGPLFSTLSESKLYRSWGIDVIGMTNVQEAKLSREAEICYATMAMVTDYDCWYSEKGEVTGIDVLKVIAQNVKIAQEIIREALKNINDVAKCGCQKALDIAVVTNLKYVPEDTLNKLEPILRDFRKRNGL
jgi:5'-methylthioadenosine phosphorylase